jgi:hypothetical protein
MFCKQYISKFICKFPYSLTGNQRKQHQLRYRQLQRYKKDRAIRAGTVKSGNFVTIFQCCGSMTFWGASWSGSADPCLWLMDPDPSIFVIDLQDASKKIILNKIFSAYYFLKLHLHHFSKIKSQKESQNSRNQGFSYYFCTMIEGSGSASIPLTRGSGSSRPKNTWIRIRNTTPIFGLG